MRDVTPVLVAAIFGCGAPEQQSHVDSARTVRDSLAAAKAATIRAIENELGASHSWAAPFDSLRRGLRQPFAIVLQNALEQGTARTFVLIGDIDDVWRDETGIGMRFFDRGLSNAAFHLRCPQAANVIPTMIRRFRISPLYVREKYAVLANELPVMQDPFASVPLTFRVDSDDGDVDATPLYIVQGRCVAIRPPYDTNR